MQRPANIHFLLMILTNAFAVRAETIASLSSREGLIGSIPNVVRNRVGQAGFACLPRGK